MKRLKKTGKKCVAWSIVAVMAATVVPPGMLVKAAEPEDETGGNLVLQYDFESLKTGTIVNDTSGNGHAGVVRPTGSGVETQQVSILGQDYTAFVMNGGDPDETHPYVEMPSGIMNGLEDTTISCWVNMKDDSTGYQRIWDLGSDTTSYMYLIANGYNTGHQGYTAALTNSGWSKEKGPEKGTALQKDEWILTTVTFDGSEKEMSLYEDGKLIGTEKTDADLSVLADSTQNWIGYGQFKNQIFNGLVADFKIYDYAMSADEVAATYNISDEDRVARDKKSLSLGDTSAVTDDMVLPGKGETGSDITWKSSNSDVISEDGKVTRPAAGEGDAEVTLTATITSGEVSEEKEFKVTVKQQLTEEEIVELDTKALDLGNLAAVSKDLKLPTSGGYGSTITWTSSAEDVIGTDGKVTRPVGTAKEVTLTATVTYGEASKTKEFKASVEPVYEKNDIVMVEEVSVETAIGTLPSLPGTVYVEYEDGSKGYEKVVWPTNLRTSDFSQEGEVPVQGQIVDSNLTVTAKVKVTKDAKTAPQQAASIFDLSDISLDGDDTIYTENKDRAMEYLKLMDADRMLYNFRATFGQDTKGAQALTGWDEPVSLN